MKFIREVIINTHKYFNDHCSMFCNRRKRVENEKLTPTDDKEWPNPEKTVPTPRVRSI